MRKDRCRQIKELYSVNDGLLIRNHKGTEVNSSKDLFNITIDRIDKYYIQDDDIESLKTMLMAVWYYFKIQNTIVK